MSDTWGGLKVVKNERYPIGYFLERGEENCLVIMEYFRDEYDVYDYEERAKILPEGKFLDLEMYYDSQGKKRSPEAAFKWALQRAGVLYEEILLSETEAEFFENEYYDMESTLIKAMTLSDEYFEKQLILHDEYDDILKEIHHVKEREQSFYDDFNPDPDEWN